METNLKKIDGKNGDDMNANRRKPLPYSAKQFIDDVHMNNAEASRLVLDMSEHLESVDALRKLMRLQHLINESERSLDEIKVTES